MPRTVTLILTAEQEAFLAAQVEGGDFASIEEVAQQLIEDAIFAREEAASDLTWLKPLVDEGLASLKEGEVITLDELRVRNRALLASLGAS